MAPPRQATGKIGGGIGGGGRGSHRRSKLKITPEAILLGVFLVWLLACFQFYIIGDLHLPQISNESGSENGGGNNAESISNGNNSGDNFPEHYMTFSTACSTSQNWQSFMFFYYAHKVSQPGYVIRIASGCSQKQQDELVEFHRTTISK